MDKILRLVVIFLHIQHKHTTFHPLQHTAALVTATETVIF